LLRLYSREYKYNVIVVCEDIEWDGVWKSSDFQHLTSHIPEQFRGTRVAAIQSEPIKLYMLFVHIKIFEHL